MFKILGKERERIFLSQNLENQEENETFTSPDWEKTISLQEFRSRFNIFAEWLKTLVKQGPSVENLKWWPTGWMEWKQ